MLSAVARRSSAFLLDVLLVAVIGAAIAIAATGGADVDIAGLHVRATSVGNLLLAAYILGALRHLTRRWSPFLAVPAWSLDRAGACAAGLVTRAYDWLTAADARTAWRLTVWLAVIVLAIKTANAWRHLGFATGDDVEIHEMTFARVFQWDWRAWDLRSPFYPMTFIFPVQRLLVSIGVTATMPLVVSGRLVVALLSTCGLFSMLSIAARQFGRPVAVIAVGVLAISGLQIGFGSTELPRPVSTVLVLGAFGCLSRRGGLRAALAGALMGVAAAMRFSELIFAAPAAMQLSAEHRWRDVATFAAAMLLVGGGIQAGSDYLYWGRPFASFVRIVDFTLVQHLSSRGYQPAWYYVTSITSWSDLFVAGLAIYASRRSNWRVALWAWLPLLLLSGLPHKEPRYVLPVIPFVALLAAIGLWDLLARVARAAPSGTRAPHLAVVLAAGLCGTFVFQTSLFHVRRSDAEVQLARELDARGDIAHLAVEQGWRLGGRLYLRHVATVVDIDPDELARPGYLESLAQTSPKLWLAISTSTCRQIDCGPRLLAQGYREQSARNDASRSGYRLFSRLMPNLSR